MIDRRAALDRSTRLIQDYVDADADTITEALTNTVVRLVADEKTVATRAGRSAVLASFETIARLGVQLDIDVPDGDGCHLPPGYPAEDLHNSLLTRAHSLITAPTVAEESDITISLSAKPAGRTAISLGGTGTTTRVRVGESAGGWHGVLPIGAGLAGSAAGAEVARLVINNLRDEFPKRDRFWSDHRPFDLSLPPLRTSSTIDLGIVDFVSAGAITQATLFLLSQIRQLTLTGRIFDDEAASIDNLNRYLLLTNHDLGINKATHVAQLASSQWNLTGVECRINDASSMPAGRPLSNTVCVGVDSVKARWICQQLAPDWVGVGATTHSLAMASDHPPEAACTACVHPADEEPTERLPTISFVTLMASTLLTHRLIESATKHQAHATRYVALNAFNLASAHTVQLETINANPSCPLSCRP
jgi:hypothetical protein